MATKVLNLNFNSHRNTMSTKSMHFLKNFFITISIVNFSMNGILAQSDETQHTPWKLDGAQERIKTIRKGDAVLSFVFDEVVPSGEIGTIDIKLNSHAFNFGVSMTQVNAFAGTPYFEAYHQRVEELFNFVTVGFYWVAYDERRDLSNFKKRMRKTIDWAQANNIKIKGHPLLWHESLPKWVIDSKDPEKLEPSIFSRIENLITTYPEIAYWDVYNEPVAPFKEHVTPNGVSRWIKYKGGIYPAMQSLYDFVNNVDASKKYTNNHYHPNDPAFLALNEFFVTNNVKYDAIGMQAHMQTNDNVLSEEELLAQVEKFAFLKKDIQFTELTVTSSKRFENWKDHQVFLEKRKEARKNGKQLNLPSLPAYEDYQAAYIKDFYTLLFSLPQISSITFWNLTDRNAWRGHAGGILDMELKPKKAFYTLKDLIKNEWSTQISKTIALENGLNFNGFYGSYKGTLSIAGKKYSFDFEHSKENKEPIKIML